jgi:hypothetical protein
MYIRQVRVGEPDNLSGPDAEGSFDVGLWGGHDFVHAGSQIYRFLPNVSLHRIRRTIRQVKLRAGKSLASGRLKPRLLRQDGVMLARHTVRSALEIYMSFDESDDDRI